MATTRVAIQRYAQAYDEWSGDSITYVETVELESKTTTWELSEIEIKHQFDEAVRQEKYLMKLQHKYYAADEEAKEAKGKATSLKRKLTSLKKLNQELDLGDKTADVQRELGAEIHELNLVTQQANQKKATVEKQLNNLPDVDDNMPDVCVIKVGKEGYREWLDTEQASDYIYNYLMDHGWTVAKPIGLAINHLKEI